MQNANVENFELLPKLNLGRKIPSQYQMGRRWKQTNVGNANLRSLQNQYFTNCSQKKILTAGKKQDSGNCCPAIELNLTSYRKEMHYQVFEHYNYYKNEID